MAFCGRVIFFSRTSSYLGPRDDLPTECFLLHPNPNARVKDLYSALFCAVPLSVSYHISPRLITWFIGRDGRPTESGSVTAAGKPPCPQTPSPRVSGVCGQGRLSVLLSSLPPQQCWPCACCSFRALLLGELEEVKGDAMVVSRVGPLVSLPGRAACGGDTLTVVAPALALSGCPELVRARLETGSLPCTTTEAASSRRRFCVCLSTCIVFKNDFL